MPDFIGLQIDRYQILEKLGQGGMAKVYLAFDHRLASNVAIKVIRRDAFSPTILKNILDRFELEAKSMACLIHTNIIPIKDYGIYDGTPYLVMPFIPGGTLKEKINQPIHYTEAVKILTPIADALAYAHDEEIIHRDVKPSNILITKTGKPVLTDFGIAKKINEREIVELTLSSMAIGTPEYMAPEQWEGKAVKNSDQYALGVILYELITGQKPYNADTPYRIMIKQATESIISPKVLVADLPEQIESILSKMLSKYPEDRYDNMWTLVKIFESFGYEKIKSQPEITIIAPVNDDLETIQIPIEPLTDDVSETIIDDQEVESNSEEHDSNSDENSDGIDSSSTDNDSDDPDVQKKNKSKIVKIFAGMIALLFLFIFIVIIQRSNNTGLFAKIPATETNFITETIENIARINESTNISAINNIPENTPSNPITQSPTFTKTPLKITPRYLTKEPTEVIQPPNLLDDYLDNTKIILAAPFIEPSKYWDYLDNPHEISNDVLKLEGISFWANNLVYKWKIAENQGIIIDYKYDQKSNCAIYIHNGEYKTSTYQRFGINPQSQTTGFQNKPAINLYRGTNYITQSLNFDTKENTWYSVFIGLDSDGAFLAVIWEKDNPNNHTGYYEYPENDWLGKKWELFISVDTGVLELSNMQRIDFTNIK